MLTPLVRIVADTVPVQFALACTVWACIIGTYRGLRVNELLRFRESAAGGMPAVARDDARVLA